MRHLLSLSLLALLALPVFGCGQPVSEATPGVRQQSLSAIGACCSSDSQCGSGLCFNTADAYPLYNPSWEDGSVCTVECEGGTAGDTYCRNLAAQYGAPRPQYARCIFARAVYDDGPDQGYYICDLIRAGLGCYWSE